MTYKERATQLAFDASVAVFVLMGAPGDVEFIPLRPKMADETRWAELEARWPGRALRFVGVIGLVGVTPQVALKEPLMPEQIEALAAAFLRHVHAFYAAQIKVAEIAELDRLYFLDDPRPYAHAN